MLGRLWRKENPPALLVGVYIGAATMENSIEVSQKTIELPFNPIIPLLDIYPDQTLIQKDTCNPCVPRSIITTTAKT